MKFNLIYICSLFFLLSNFSFSQNKFSLFVDDEEDDSITKRYYELHDGHWAGIDFGLNFMVDNTFKRSFESNSQFKNNILSSFNFKVNFIDHKFVIKEDRLGITIGAGYNHTSYDLIKNYTLKQSFDKSNNSTKVNQSFDSLNFTYNKIRASYLQIPILLEYTPTKNSWVSIGLIAGYRFGSSTKNLFEYQKIQYITKSKGDFNLNTFQCDGTLRFGFKSLGGFISYSFIPLFNENDIYENNVAKGRITSIHPISFGLTFNY